MIYTIVHDFLEVSINNNWASQVALVIKNLSANAGDARDTGLIPGLGRSPRGGSNNPHQFSCLENPVDRGPWSHGEPDMTDHEHTQS